MTFCTDADLLAWDAELIATAQIASQTLLRATGVSLSGATLTLSSGSFLTARVAAGQVAVLSGGLAGAFPIVGVESATSCKLSVNAESLDETPPATTSIGNATALELVVRTFYPQRKIVADLICKLIGIEPAEAWQIVSAASLRRAAVLGTLQQVSHLLSGAGATELAARAAGYGKLFHRELRGRRVELDLDGDGRGDTTRILKQIVLERT
jgi:hypothetical protein